MGPPAASEKLASLLVYGPGKMAGALLISPCILRFISAMPSLMYVAPGHGLLARALGHLPSAPMSAPSGWPVPDREQRSRGQVPMERSLTSVLNECTDVSSCIA